MRICTGQPTPTVRVTSPSSLTATKTGIGAATAMCTHISAKSWVLF
eukprot:CAMPEP_0206268202 /NCGR_PEP_ID=MMETSP0047_2-20121206/31576_1 /ASSEMBLY_ACC=CAM_ASM_000192 /TAXON_ID=195065 /ORGANISM="Chroomonas mesostigmatica_cf, Strain CCMP1168" /LENGTH=45 /DNA_ID= /DNA_START= /DNA_END= /DNA_ORIENTATION=